MAREGIGVYGFEDSGFSGIGAGTGRGSFGPVERFDRQHHDNQHARCAARTFGAAGTVSAARTGDDARGRGLPSARKAAGRQYSTDDGQHRSNAMRGDNEHVRDEHTRG